MYERGLVLDTEALGYVFMPFSEMARVEIQSKGIVCHYSGETPVCQSLQTGEVRVAMKQHDVISTIVQLIQTEGVEYSYGEQKTQEKKKCMASRLDYLQYRQNTSSNKTLKPLSIGQYLEGEALYQQQQRDSTSLADKVNWVIVDGRDVE